MNTLTHIRSAGQGQSVLPESEIYLGHLITYLTDPDRQLAPLTAFILPPVGNGWRLGLHFHLAATCQYEARRDVDMKLAEREAEEAERWSGME